jgi:DNA polymerase I-like protein with 3'-5' exonuclease and polymerase domains
VDEKQTELLVKTVAEGEWLWPGRLSSALASYDPPDPFGWRAIIDEALDAGIIKWGGPGERIKIVSAEDVEARQEAMKFADAHTPMALEHTEPQIPPSPEKPIDATVAEEVIAELTPPLEALADRPVPLVCRGCEFVTDEPVMMEQHAELAHGQTIKIPPLVPNPEGMHIVTTPEPQKKRRRTAEEVAADKAAKAAEREMTRLHAEALKLELARTKAIDKEAAKVAKAQEREQAKTDRAAAKVQAKIDEKLARVAEAEGGRVELPAVVLRNGYVGHVSDKDAWDVITMYLSLLCVDCETSGYPLGHKLYELRTVQLGGEEAAVVFDASDPNQMAIVALALDMAAKLSAFSAIADVIPLVAAGVIDWAAIWAKMYDAVFNAKLTDPKMSGSDADALKELSTQVLGDYAVSRESEIAKNALFKAMGCLTDTKLTTEPERNGWLRVNRNSVVMTRYAGSDVLDLAAVIRVLPPIPVSQAVVEREREFQDSCAKVNLDGMALDHPHILRKIDEEEEAKALALQDVLVLSDGKIVNPKSPDVIKAIPELFPDVRMPINRKSKNESADKESLEKLCRDYPADQYPERFYLFKRILAYRHHDTTLSLLLRPLQILCEHGDGRMRPTVYTIEASTGRTSCRRPNGQQFSRQGGVRACVVADPGFLGISADFEGCEIRVAAALSGDYGLYEAEISPWCYKCERDAFISEPCSCGIKEDGTLKAHQGLHWRTAHGATKDATKEHRYQAKRGTFTRLFGGGADTAAAQVGCPVWQMESIFKSFDDNAPDFTAWDGWMRDCYKQGTMVWRDYAKGENYSVPIDGSNRMIYQTYTGRNIYINNGAHAAGNGAIQGTARELLVDGTLEWRKTRWGGYGLLPIHDQIFTFVPQDEALAATRVLANCMQTDVLSSPGFTIHIGADVDVPFLAWPDSS